MSKSNLRLVLMSCCAPCSCGAIAECALNADLDDFIVLFYNPNIFPESEYQKRLVEQIKFCESIGVKYAIGDWTHDKWLSCVRRLENEPERGRRCAECFRHRFAFGAKWAAKHGYNTITSVFGISRHKSQKQVDEAAREITGPVVYLPVDWNKQIRQKIIENAGFYHQNYCGCEWSVRAV